MKTKLFFFFLLFGQILPAQSFTEVLPAFPFDGVLQGSVAFSDVDGDGDEDVLITGENGARERIAKLYTNAEGSFVETAGIPFVVAQSGKFRHALSRHCGWVNYPELF